MGTQTQSQPQTQKGWTMFDDRIGKEYNLSADQMTRLRDLDTRYSSEYKGLGNDPMTNPGYKSLTDRRNREVRTIMGEDAYMRWEKRYGGQMAPKPTTPTPAPNGGTNTTPPPPAPPKK